MKKLFILALMLMAVVVVKAQDPMFLKEDKIVNLGVGLGYYSSISASLDYCIADGVADKGSIGVGPYVGFGIRKYYSAVLAGVRGTFHYPVIEDIDTYVGFGMGASIGRYTYYSYASTYTDFDGGFFLGARYGINETLTVFGELGYGINYLNIGIALNF